MHIFGQGMRKALALGVALLCMDGNTGLALAQADAGQSKQPDQGKTPDAAMPTAIIYGAVVSTKDQTPLKGVPILLKNTQTGEVIVKESDPQGAYIFNHLPAGIYRILVGGGSYSLQKKEGVLKAGMVGEMNFRVAVLSSGDSSLLGSIYEGHGDRKIPLAAQMQIKNVKTHEVYTIGSGPSGTFSLDKIPAGRYLVQVLKKGYLPVSEEVAVNGKTSRNFRLSLNKLASADINADTSKKIKDTTGAITVVGHKTFETWQTTGIGFALSNQPGINYYSRSGANGVTGGMNYFTCRGYSTGGSNTAPSGGSNIEFEVEGVPFNENQDGGMVYDLNLFNIDIASVDIQRGVTTSANLYNYASGCNVNIHLMQPTKDAFSQITSGMGSYNQYYTSFISNTGINEKTGVGAYNDLSLINQQGFQEFTGLQEYQDYANLTKYLEAGKISLMFTGAYKNYDRGSSTSLQNFNQFGPTYNGLPNGENTGYASGTNTPDSPYYKNWLSQRYMVTIQGEDQLNPTVWVKNNAFALVMPESIIMVPVGIDGSPVQGGGGTAFQNVVPSYGGACNNTSAGSASECANPFNFTYIQGQGYKVGDIAETAIQTFKGNKVHMGARLSYNNTQYGNMPIGTPKITGNAGGSNLMATVGGYVEDHYRPTDDWLFSAGVRVMAVSQQYVNSMMSGAQTATNAAGNGNGPTGNAAYAESAGQNFVVPLPHVGANWYPSDHWKVYVNAGQSYSAPSLQFFEVPVGQGPNAMTIKPEIVNDVEAGVRYSTDKGFVAFDIYNDYINNMFTTSLQLLPGNITNTVPDTAGLAEMRGVEAEFKRDLPAGFSVDGSFSAVDAYFVSAQYGLGTSTVLSNSGDPLPFVPNMLANLDLNYTKGNWHATVNERYTGMMNVIDTSGGPTGTANIQMNAPGYWATNLLLAYDLPKVSWYKSAQLFFNAFNLLNTNYYEPAFLSPGANNLETMFVYPGEPINVFGGVTMTF